MPCYQMGSETVLGCSAPSPHPGHSQDRAIQHAAKVLDPACNLKENFCGRKLRLTEEDSPSTLVHLQETKKQLQQMEKALEEKKLVRKMGG